MRRLIAVLAFLCVANTGVPAIAQPAPAAVPPDGTYTYAVTQGGKDSVAHDIKVNDFQIAANYWATKHVRVTLEYSLYMFPGTPPSDPGFKGAADANLAGGPGSGTIGDDGKTKRGKDANSLHEISFRIAFAI